jgi:hypothetical protein
MTAPKGAPVPHPGRCLSLWLSFAIAATGGANPGPPPPDPTAELRALAEADQRSRIPPNNPDPAADEVRKQRVLAMLVAGQIRTPESKEFAALILQHSGLAFCDGALKATSLDNYLLAYLLAKSAAEDGRKSALSLAAAALDRFLVFSGKPQKFGTQTVLDPKTDRMVVPPIDPATTDEERARWGVEPLAKFLKHALEQNP